MIVAWTEPEVETLKRLLAQHGYNIPLLCQELGKNKNQVIGKVNRDGLAKPDIPEPLVVKKPHNFHSSNKRHAPMPAASGGSRAAMAAAVQDLRENQCRWLQGEGDEFSFCNARQKEGFSYCAHHQSISVHQEE